MLSRIRNTSALVTRCASCGVKTTATLLDEGEVEARREGDGGQKIRVVDVVVGAWNGGVLVHGEARNRRRELVAEVRILVAAAVACPKRGVDGELHQIRKAPDLVGAGRGAAGQSAKSIEADGIETLRNQIGVEERFVAQLIFGVVVDVLRHVGV